MRSEIYRSNERIGEEQGQQLQCGTRATVNPSVRFLSLQNNLELQLRIIRRFFCEGWKAFRGCFSLANLVRCWDYRSSFC